MVKKISIVITVVLAVSLIFAICYSQHEAQANAEYYEKLDKSALPLKVQKDELERELSVLEKEYSEQMKGAATEELLVTDLDKSLYSDLFPMTQEADVAGILVLSDDEFFGNTGKITGKQFDELRKAGWSYCLGWNGEGKFEDWMKKMSALLKKSGLSIPNAVYFAEGSYSAELDNILLQYGLDFDILVF